MIRARVVAVMAVATACAAFGQSPAAPLSFEVASLKPSVPPLDGRLMIRMRDFPGRVEFSSVSLKAIIQRACEVQDYQVSGPDWMASTRFDVVAKLPAGAPKSKIPEMLRSLLAERFEQEKVKSRQMITPTPTARRSSLRSNRSLGSNWMPKKAPWS